MLALSAALGAFGRRVAGGVIGDWTGWPPPHLAAVLFYGLMVGCAALLGGGCWQFASVAGINAWLGHIMGLWNGAGMGHYGDGNEFWCVGGDTRKIPVSYSVPFTSELLFGCWVSAVDSKPHRKPGYLLSCCGLWLYGFLSVVLSIAFVAFCPLGSRYSIIPLICAPFVLPIVYSITWRVFWWKPIGWPPGFGPPLALAEWPTGATIALAAALSAAT